MIPVVYDGSFAGLLTTIFEVYEYKLSDTAIYKADAVPTSLFGAVHKVHTDEVKAEKVLRKLKEKLSPIAVGQFYKTFLSELPSIETHLLRYVQYAISSKQPVENDYSHPDVLMLQQVSRKVQREKHRMEAFVRFQLTREGLYYAMIQPDYNVLLLIAKHFKDRYADQRWLIYDTRRKYGLYYDLEQVSEVQLHFDIDHNNSNELAAIFDESE